MDHVTALNERSAERYVLGEMSSVETEQFERHFFECEECALAVEECQVLAGNARAVLSEAEPEALSEESNGPPKPSFGDALRAWWYRPLALLPAGVDSDPTGARPRIGLANSAPSPVPGLVAVSPRPCSGVPISTRSRLWRATGSAERRQARRH